MDRILVVAATHAEAAHVPPHLPVVVTGLGKTAAAVATTEALVGVEREGLTVINIGSAGALRDGLSGCHEAGTVLAARDRSGLAGHRLSRSRRTAVMARDSMSEPAQPRRLLKKRNIGDLSLECRTPPRAQAGRRSRVRVD